MRNIRFIALAAFALVRVASFATTAGAEDTKELHIGYQKGGIELILKQQGALEQRLAKQGISVSWREFPAGPPLLEALNAGAIDFGETGDTPPIFAQAAGTELVYVAAVPAPGASSAILVHRDAPIHTLADLKGRKVAFTKGSSAHNVLVQVLARAGLAYGDIHPVYLSPADAAAAFASGSIDAWSIWDPYYALAEQKQAARVLTTAEGVAPSNSFFLARKAYATHNPRVIATAVEELGDAIRWSRDHPEELAQYLNRETGVDIAAVRVSVARRSFAVEPLSAKVVAQQQSIADTFEKLGLIPRHIDVQQAIWVQPGS